MAVFWHQSIGKNEGWSIDVIGGVIRIDSETNTTYIRITQDDNPNVITLRLKRSKKGF